MPRVRNPFGGDTRRLDGITVTAIDLETGHLRTVTDRCMGVLDGLRYIVARLERMPGTWRIQSVSTPGTIYRDLHGHREQDEPHKREKRQRQPYPESDLLGKIGREDMLA